MQLEIHQTNGITVFSLSDKIIGRDSAELKTAIAQAIDNRTTNPKLLFDFSKVSMMDSCGLGTLAAAHVSVGRQNGRIGVIVGNKIRNLLVMAKLITIFERFETETEAVQQLSN